MPQPVIVLDEDQADDLRELTALTAIVQQWLEHAADHILNDLAGFAYPHTFHPRSYAHWLAEDLASITTRLQQATNSSRDPLDTPASIGNQIPPSRRESSRSEGVSDSVGRPAACGVVLREGPADRHDNHDQGADRDPHPEPRLRWICRIACWRTSCSLLAGSPAPLSRGV
jgi:hypothetical protein